MPNEYSGDGKIILRDTSGNQMSLPRFFQLALVDQNGNYARPTDARAGHYAWDMGTGTALTVPARTPAFGTVISASDGWNGGMGTHVIIEDELGQQHRFMHMVEGSLLVSVGSSVSQGDQLGFIGNTGDSQGAHLHYDVLKNGTLLNEPIDAYDCTTLPTGWTFAGAVADGNNWDYIPLDTGATDYGPPGGDTPSEPYFPNTVVYDIAHPQVQSGSLDAVLEAIAATDTGGVIIQIGNIKNDGYHQETSFSGAQAVQKALDLGLALGVYFYNYAAYENDMTSAFEAALADLQSMGATPDKLKLGVWLDTEQSGHSWDPTPNPDPNVNYAYVERYMNVFEAANYPAAGVYGNAAMLANNYPAASIGDKPLWAALWVSSSFDSLSRESSALTAYFPVDVYTNLYIWQVTDSRSISGWSGALDGNKVVTPIPTSGGGGGGGGSYTEVIKVTVDIKPPKRIYFSPVPGIIPTTDELLSERSQVIEITTDADNADLYYTLDGSSPYQYTVNNDSVVYALAANALQYGSSITIYKDTHIRVVAVPTGTEVGEIFDEPLAKGSGTFLFEYHNLTQDWESEQLSYATSDNNTSFFEENRQAFLRLHAEQTEEEVLYAEVYRHDTQSAESDATDDASSTEQGPEPTYDGESEPEEVEEDVSD